MHMKKLAALFALAAMIFGIHAAAESVLTLDFDIPDNGAIVIPATARFNIFSQEGEWLANEPCDIFADTRRAGVVFNLPEYKAGEVFTVVPTIGISSVNYNGVDYAIDDEIKLDTALGSSFAMNAVPLFIPPTGLRANSITFHFDVLQRGIIEPSAARFNLFDKDGQWLANDAVRINSGNRKTLVFSLPEYYTGEIFYLCPTVGMTDVNYNGRTFKPNEMIEVQTYAYTADNGYSMAGTEFHLNLTPIYHIPALDTPGASDISATEFVNNSGVNSRTNYLIWISKKDYKVSVFLGSKGNWQFVKSFDCSIGAPSTPTITGQFEYYMYQPRWAYDTYYVGPVMRFAKGGYAIHSTLIRYNGTPADGRLKMKISHGCVRVAQENVKWMVDYIPLNTRVYITE